jgi:hypothetical protein
MRIREKCPHGKQKWHCKDCGGSQICKHKKALSYCIECGGRAICKHRRQRHHCKECGGFPVLAEMMYNGARQRARKNNLYMDITPQDILELIGDGTCPVLGIPYRLSCRFPTDDSASLDRFKPTTGYVKGNVFVVSNLANRIKTSATSDQVQMVADWMRKTQEKI